MSSRYVEDRDYHRSTTDSRRRADRDPRERVDSTRDRRIDDRPLDRSRDTHMTDAMDIAIDRRVDPRLDPRMDPRIDIGRDTARANTASRIDPPRPDRMVDSRSAEPIEKYVQDPTTGQLYRQVPARAPYTRGDDRDYIDPPLPRSRTAVDPPASRSRTAVDTPMRDDRIRDEPRTALGDYWCPGEGIEREVLQHEICKFLGQDATCRPGQDSRGRPGFWVRAYRPFTTAMEQTLREESERWLREKERRRRHGEPRGMPPSDSSKIWSKSGTGSYEQLAQQETQTARRYPGDMDLDDDDYRQPPPIRHRDPRDPRDPRDRDMEPPRPVASGRIPVSTGYPPEPGYPAQYTISSQQPGYPTGQSQYYGTEREPRTFNSGNTTPPSAISRASQSGGYGQPGYSSRSAPPVSQSIPAPYDPRSRDIMSGAYSSGYSESRPRR
ncbi:hypothetical protein A1O7_03220 [Cladophialophora yegresii CBS 114405]|uniref:Uncharacterized protein n=1 Tax=Cladophialophora yegresii CBS 114405 TaxID=1182544 RepID=W9WDZ8_9EURO|nr:uncharacterized protein A1O7_03220 [Cladophialophora yegresii CBS 114405]EXJ62781.1 hypothetical protein A1O7_03220 [Cladophialophora yegresii CBS 114405]